ncbi:hypothetical protein TNCV_1085081 [Trichonephila clavipes]|nr:hypothetical protein TNCV_1085081 [Trichonephila clavipes]
MYNKLLLYTAVLRPILTYGSPVWGYAADSNIKTLEVAQRLDYQEIYERVFMNGAILESSPRVIAGRSHSFEPRTSDENCTDRALPVEPVGSSGLQGAAPTQRERFNYGDKASKMEKLKLEREKLKKN